jgi:uncharacterized protein (TIGR02444 family)
VLQCDNPFWSFSLAVYAAPGVAAECLALQDTSGVDVNVLLFCAWLGATRRSVLTLEDFAAIEAAVEPWRDTVIRPMRVFAAASRHCRIQRMTPLPRCGRMPQLSNCARSRLNRRSFTG